jgi:hypothetical protein
LFVKSKYWPYISSEMKLLSNDHLVQSVQDVMKAVSSRTTIPILTGIKLVASDESTDVIDFPYE